jgi:hypothetical protein
MASLTDEQREEQAWKLTLDYLAASTPAQKHIYIAQSNYDGNNRGIRYLIDNPALAQGSAIMLYWFLGADGFKRMSPDEIRDYQKDKLALIDLIEQRVASGFYQGEAIAFDPHEGIVPPGEYESLGPLVQPVPPAMYEPTAGEPVDLDEAAGQYDEGLPESVATAVWALWDK